MSKVQFTCPLCEGQKGDQRFKAFDFDQSVEPFDIVQCAQCGLAQTSPIPDDETLDRYYSKPYYGSGKKKFSWIIESLTVLGNRLRARKIFRAMARTGAGGTYPKVLDIGCGRANLLRWFRRSGCECHGTERGVFPADSDPEGIQIHRGSLEEAGFEDSSFDAVVIWHVLEHLDQPLETLDIMSRITRQGGVAAIAVPNFSSLQSRWFKGSWFHLDLPRHLYHFDVDNLRRALKDRGYEIDSVTTCSPEQNLFGFLQSAMNLPWLPGKPNQFYQLLKHRPGFRNHLKLAFWLLVSLLMMPFALLEFVLSCALRKGASALIFAHKT
jgi:SAM-dependent methyltransferase